MMEKVVHKNCLVGLECPIDLGQRDDFELALQNLSTIEIIPESFFFDRHSSFIKKLAAKNIPIVGHSVDMSFASAEPINWQHFDQIMRVLEQVNCVVYSDHLCMTTVSGIEIGQLTTVPFTQEVVDVACRKIEQVQKRIPMPFMIENITNRFLYPHSELHEADFINAVTQKSGCGLLLDVTNLYINSVNFAFDPYQWLDKIEASSIMGIHLAGGVEEEGILYDSHSRPVPQEVWRLLQYVLKKSSPQYMIVEWDGDMPSTERLLQEVETAEEILYSPNKQVCSKGEVL